MTDNEKKSLYESIMKELSETITHHLYETAVQESMVTVLKRRGFKRYEQPEDTWFLPNENYKTNERFIFKNGWCIQRALDRKFYFVKQSFSYSTQVMLINDEKDLDEALKMFGIKIINN